MALSFLLGTAVAARATTCLAEDPKQVFDESVAVFFALVTRTEVEPADFPQSDEENKEVRVRADFEVLEVLKGDPVVVTELVYSVAASPHYRHRPVTVCRNTLTPPTILLVFARHPGVYHYVCCGLGGEWDHDLELLANLRQWAREASSGAPSGRE